MLQQSQNVWACIYGFIQKMHFLQENYFPFVTWVVAAQAAQLAALLQLAASLGFEFCSLSLLMLLHDAAF